MSYFTWPGARKKNTPTSVPARTGIPLAERRRAFFNGIYNFNALSASELTFAIDKQEANSTVVAAEEDTKVPKLHFLGKKRSGKTSILRVVFHAENASDTLYLESTSKLVMENKNSCIDFDIHDYPAAISVGDPESSPKTIFSSPGALVWVIDAQDEYWESIDRLLGTLFQFSQVLGGVQNPPPPKEGAEFKFPSNFHLPSHLSLNIFIHKTDGLSDDFKDEIVQDIQEKITMTLANAGLPDLASSASFYQTSIYDHTIFDSVSKVVQKLMNQNKHATMEAMINSLCSNCKIEKAYLFDIQWKIYFASDTSPQDMRSFETCSDHLDMVRDINKIYGWPEAPPKEEGTEFYDDFHAESLCQMERSGHHYLFLKAITKHLSLSCIMGEDNPEEHQAIIEKNFRVFQKGIQDVLSFDIAKA